MNEGNCPNYIVFGTVAEANAFRQGYEFATKWHDVATAPKDGTYILCYGNSADDGFFLAHWEYMAWRNQNGPTNSFTHWRPLPDSPAEENS